MEAKRKQPGETCLACEECGGAEAMRIGGRCLCLDCYAAAGSCCPEFEGRSGGDEGESAG